MEYSVRTQPYVSIEVSAPPLHSPAVLVVAWREARRQDTCGLSGAGLRHRARSGRATEERLAAPACLLTPLEHSESVGRNAFPRNCTCARPTRQESRMHVRSSGGIGSWRRGVSCRVVSCLRFAARQPVRRRLPCRRPCSPEP